ncbi:hypothetical protein ABPG72_019867 [Tetrahymena utriculariae]
MADNNTIISKVNNELKSTTNGLQDQGLIQDLYNNQIQSVQQNLNSYDQDANSLQEQLQNLQNQNDYLELSFENYRSFSEFQNEEEEEDEQFSIWSEDDLFEFSINANINDYNKRQQLDLYFIYRSCTVLYQPMNVSNQDRKITNSQKHKQLTTLNQNNQYIKNTKRKSQQKTQKELNTRKKQFAGLYSKKHAKKINTKSFKKNKLKFQMIGFMLISQQLFNNLNVLLISTPKQAISPPVRQQKHMVYTK